jgi:hypothetical protein
LCWDWFSWVGISCHRKEKLVLQLRLLPLQKLHLRQRRLRIMLQQTAASLLQRRLHLAKLLLHLLQKLPLKVVDQVMMIRLRLRDNNRQEVY